MKEYDDSDPEIQADPSLKATIRGLRPVIEDILGKSAGLVKVRWTAREDNQGHRILQLRLSDFTMPEGIATDFAPRELDDPKQFWRKAHDLWGDLLFGGLRAINARLQASLPELEVAE